MLGAISIVTARSRLGSVFCCGAAGVVALFLYFTTPTKADLNSDIGALIAHLLRVPVPLIEAGKELKELNDKLAVVADITKKASGDPSVQLPVGLFDEFGNLAKSYREIAARIEKSEIPTDFEYSAFSVSWTDFLACHTRDQSLTTLSEYSLALGSALERGSEALHTSKEDIALVEATDQAINAISESILAAPNISSTHATAIGLILNEKPALTHLRNTLRDREKKILNTVQLVSTKKGNLDFNIDQLRRVDCDLSGGWTGTIVTDEVTNSMSLEITGPAPNYKISYAINQKTNKNPCVVSVDAKKRVLVLRASCTPPSSDITLSLSISESYTSMSGEMTDAMDEFVRFPIELRRR